MEARRGLRSSPQAAPGKRTFRFQAPGIPVVLSGECGCGKTFVIRFLAEWLHASLLVLNVHGGTTAAEVVGILQSAEDLLMEDDRALDAAQSAAEGAAAPQPATSTDEEEAVFGAAGVGTVEEGVEAEGKERGDEEEGGIRKEQGSPEEGEAAATAAEEKKEEEEEEEEEAEEEGADEEVPTEQRRVFVFFDELNACAHVAMMVEAITKHSIGGRPLHPRLRILAAVNPHRKRAAREGGGGSPGLVFNLGGEVQDAMSELVYRVHPIPTSLQQFVFDFGYLEADQETQYLKAILARHLGALRVELELEVHRRDAHCALALLLASQASVRKYENDPSAVSLRDAVRACELLDWFALRILKKQEERRADLAAAAAAGVAPPARAKRATKGPAVSPLAASLVLALAFVYMYRLPDTAARQRYWAALLGALRGARDGFARGRHPEGLTEAWRVLRAEDCGFGAEGERSAAQARALAAEFDGCGFAGLMQEGRCAAVLAQVQKKFVRNMEVEEGIAMNEALSENLFVTCICVLNLLPLFIVGKPGTSKTLTMQVLSNNLQGSRSPSSFFRQFPAMHVFPYQCSPMSASGAIQHQFDSACRFQQHATSIVAVLLLDEVGLAEHSPDMPLKVLHAMLVKPPVAIVGLSNWTLDSAKMNRAICIQRTEPSPLDIEHTAQSIVAPAAAALAIAPVAASAAAAPPKPCRQHTAERRAATWLRPICTAYHEVYTAQRGRDFLGMRDLYAAACRRVLAARGSRRPPRPMTSALHVRRLAGTRASRSWEGCGWAAGWRGGARRTRWRSSSMRWRATLAGSRRSWSGCSRRFTRSAWPRPTHTA